MEMANKFCEWEVTQAQGGSEDQVESEFLVGE